MPVANLKRRKGGLGTPNHIYIYIYRNAKRTYDIDHYTLLVFIGYSIAINLLLLLSLLVEGVHYPGDLFSGGRHRSAAPCGALAAACHAGLQRAAAASLPHFLISLGGYSYAAQEGGIARVK